MLVIFFFNFDVLSLTINVSKSKVPKMLNIDYYLLTKNGESIVCVTHSECFFF